jgi:hypothetical protein
MRSTTSSDKQDPSVATGSYELMLEEDVQQAKAGSGYNPYDTWPNVRQAGVTQRQADLRRLSDWIRVKRQVATTRKSDKG